MIELTVGQVSGVIALGSFFLQVLIPTAIIATLVGLLRDENTASTWSVIGRLVHSSYWPLILNSETVTGRHVPFRVELFAYLTPLSLFLVAIAGIVTPLGLYDAFDSGSTTTVPFVYVRDDSPIGVATPPRSALGYNRYCGFFISSKACPGSNTVVHREKYPNGTTTLDLPHGYNVSIPQELYDLFSSGTPEGKSVAGQFDIQWRLYTTQQRPEVNNGSRVLVGNYRPLETLILKDEDYHLIEGLVVDMRTPGVGMRNHTIPTRVRHGATWTEDLLFVQPETQCVGNNLSIDYTLGGFSSAQRTAERVTLRDGGGFSSLTPVFPDGQWTDPQNDPELRSRAYVAAWNTNYLLATYFNVTAPGVPYVTSKLGDEIELAARQNTIRPLQSVRSKTDFDLIKEYEQYWSLMDIENPHEIYFTNYTVGQKLCQGAGPEDPGNISSLAISCGMLLGAAQQIEGERSASLTPGTRWSIPIYSCATVAKAIVKKVTFEARGPSLRDVKVLDITDKSYSSTSPMPLWGVENTRLNLTDASPLWGILSTSHAAQSTSDFSTIERPHLYLPGKQATAAYLDIQDNLPGVQFHTFGMSAAYDIGSDISEGFDYTGKTNIALFTRWQELSKTPETASRLVNTVWTDTVANIIVGSKSLLGGPFVEDGQGRASTDTVDHTVVLILKKVKFDIVYGIPAFVVLLLWLITAFVAGTLFLTNRVSLERIRHYLRCTAAGRLLATAVHPRISNLTMSSSNWTRQAGGVVVALSGEYPRGKADDQGLMQEGNDGRGKESSPEQ